MKRLGLIVVALVAMQSAAVGDTLVLNGSFEQNSLADPTPPSGFVTVSATPYDPNPAITNWLVDINTDVDLVSTAWEPSDGTFSLDLNGRQAGAIYQSFTTVPNQQYLVSFDLAANPFNAPVPASMRVSAAGAYQDFNFDRTGFTPTDMGWQSQSWSFVATDTSTTLRFESLVSGAGGVALDNVAVNAVVPAPSTITMLVGTALTAFGLLWAPRRLKR